MRTAVGITQVC